MALAHVANPRRATANLPPDRFAYPRRREAQDRARECVRSAAHHGNTSPARQSARRSLSSAISKLFSIYDADECLIRIDHTVCETKRNFLKLHEAGHHELPTHGKLFPIFQECEKTLEPEITDLFEREANNFARFVLFQGDG